MSAEREAEHEAVTARVPTCAELWDFYIRDHVQKKCARPDVQHYAWERMKDRFGPLLPSQVTQKIVDAHVAARWPTKPSTLHTELSLLRVSWNYGVKKRLIASTELPPVDLLTFPDAPPPRERWLREEEVERLFNAAADLRGGDRLSRVERFMWIALETGARRNAILELRWDQVDFETKVLHLNPEGRVQTTKRRADVPISDALLPVLRRAHAERISGLVLDRSNRLHDLLDRVAARAGVEGVTAHVFRHTMATWMARRGVPLWKIAKVLGNTVEQVEKVYAKHCPDDLRESVNLVSGPRLLRAV